MLEEFRKLQKMWGKMKGAECWGWGGRGLFVHIPLFFLSTDDVLALRCAPLARHNRNEASAEGADFLSSLLLCIFGS